MGFISMNSSSHVLPGILRTCNLMVTWAHVCRPWCLGKSDSSFKSSCYEKKVMRTLTGFGTYTSLKL